MMACYNSCSGSSASLRIKAPVAYAALLAIAVVGCTPQHGPSSAPSSAEPAKSPPALHFRTYFAHTPNSGPADIALSSDGAAWFIEANSPRSSIAFIDPNRKLTEFKFPADQRLGGIAAAADGGLWFSNYDSIGFITRSGHITMFSIPGHEHPRLRTIDNLAVDRRGGVWFTDSGSFGGAIGRLTPDGSVTEQSIEGNPFDVAVDLNGAVWFTLPDRNTIGKRSMTGRVVYYKLRTRNDEAHPRDRILRIAYGKPYIWFLNDGGNRIGRISENGTIVEYSVPGRRDFAEIDFSGIAVDKDDDAWFTESFDDRVGRFKPSGELDQYSYPLPFARPWGIAVSHHNIWITANAANAVSVARMP